MTKLFRYEAYDLNGALVRGEIEAASREAALSSLRARKLFPYSTEDAEAKSAPMLQREVFLSPPISRANAALFLREMAALLAAEIAVDTALSIAGGEVRSRRGRAVIDDMRSRVRRGEGLSEAMNAHQQVFRALDVALVRSGEAAGDIAAAMTTAAEIAERESVIRSKIVSAMIYPTILTITAIAAMLIVTTVLAPSLSPLFARTGASPPPAFAAMLGVSYLVRNFWWALLLGAAVLLFACTRALRNETVAYAAHQFILRSPLLGSIVANLETSRLFRALAALLRSGAPLPEALTVGQDVSSSLVFRRAVQDARERVRQGETLSSSIESLSALPPAALRLLQIGERSARLEQMIEHAANQTDTAAQRGIDRLLTALNPTLTLVLGLIVGGMIATVLSTILGANELLFS